MIEKKGPEEVEERKELLQNVYSYHQADETLKVAQPSAWLFLGSVFVLLAGIIIWSFVGKIPTEVMGKTIAVHPDSLFMVQSKNNGIVNTINVKEGDVVPRGALLGTLNNTTQQSTIYQINSEREKLQSLNEEIKLILSNYEVRARLFEEGLVAKTVVDNTKIELINKQIERDNVRNTIFKLISDLEMTSQYWEKTISKDIDNPKTYEDLTRIKNRLSNFYASEEVKILEILVKPQEHVEVGQQLFWVQSIKKTKSPLVFYTGIPLEDGNKTKIGMTVYIELQNVNNQEYGKLIAKISDVYPYAISEKELLTIIKNPQIARYLTNEGKPISLATAEALSDPNTISGYKWTSKSGPPFKISAGTVGSAAITVDEQPPISYLIPLWKIKP